MPELLSSIIDINILNEMNLSERSKKMFLNSIKKYDDYIERREYNKKRKYDFSNEYNESNVYKKGKYEEFHDSDFEDEEYDFEYDKSNEDDKDSKKQNFNSLYDEFVKLNFLKIKKESSNISDNDIYKYIDRLWSNYKKL
ncbi:MAG TPA: hypothetical protein VIY08_11545 [Candidatus Nitrosocosmicus sp.]